jgi:hypothetical protein
MGFYDDIKVLEDISGKNEKTKVRPIHYPSYQKATILTLHLRRALIPRQINIRSGVEIKTWMFKEGVFNPFFTHSVLKRAVKVANVCSSCLTGAWAYIRVGQKTHILWMRGKGKNIDFIKGD